MNQSNNQNILSVSQLNRSAKQLLETHLSLIWVEGEISNFAQPSSGHWYLTLKDRSAQVKAAMFRGRNQQVRFAPQNGLKVLVRARVSIYEGRGDYQLIIEHMQAAGAGDLQLQFEQLKAKLQEQGLFEAENKKQIPAHPARIGIISSATGAALHDILSVLSRRNPLAELKLFPTAVQGEAAPQQIINAIELANRHQACDVLLISRGGGSIEDLWAFNNEQLALCIASSNIPTVSAVGHEVDFTIADFVADLRAPTPSAAAELLSPDIEQMRLNIEGFQLLLQQALQRQLKDKRQKLAATAARLRHPGDKLQQQAQQLDQFEQRLIRNQKTAIDKHTERLANISLRLKQQSPSKAVSQNLVKVKSLAARLARSSEQLQHSRNTKLSHLADLLQGVSPLATMGRGYSVTRNAEGKIISNSSKIKEGDSISIQFHQGSADCTIKATQP